MVPGIRFLNTVVDHSTRTIMMYVVAPTFCVLTGTVSAKTASADTGSNTQAAPGKVEGNGATRDSFSMVMKKNGVVPCTLCCVNLLACVLQVGEKKEGRKEGRERKNMVR